MGKPLISTTLTINQLSDGYSKTISTAFRLLEGSMDLAKDYPEIALGLAEIGQEELGKSLSLLAAFHLPQKPEDWKWLWSGWTNHQLKCHRAFLYELIHPRRIELHNSDGMLTAGGPLREKIQHEKESSFYVNFDSGRFISPQDSIKLLETANRVFTLLNLAVTAFYLENALRAKDESFRLQAFAEIAFRICSEELYQQDVPAILAEFESRSTQHASLVTDLREQLAAGDQYLKSIRSTKEQSRTP